MNEVFIITGDQGEYDDYTTWIESVHFTLESAKAAWLALTGRNARLTNGTRKGWQWRRGAFESYHIERWTEEGEDADSVWPKTANEINEAILSFLMDKNKGEDE